MGMWELVVVLIVGLIVLGPERLPVAIRTVSRWMKTLKSVANSVKAEVNEELRIHELHENLKKAEQQNLKELSPELQDSVNELQKAAQSVTHSYKKDNQEETKVENSEKK
ncbi:MULTISPECIES: Sec-independent protein translocase protein TatB [Pseudoalteromonas]|jgi:sec-independent protein translocase protein TatB|uniref:Sec-independent protein translocase protein TatB n=1 Tax=Pseudoalteromonas lipolytica TaxID=570156 RepID=A0AAD0S1Y1_9GAMM|nr:MULTISPECIES: Sec-independent protein translocase protein TatB [Pseudoalteromonas]AXV66675.1 Sec-independent protein translocase subunit TatB [Pseudoalteromonas donghaensis]EWH04802.1 translocase [Pseudoalteromonas lipolytica SCSIO 04301]MBE0349399.1 sec-independent protein translocase protein TatB [Pseudoalteromonas lipolytica LMEB 39]QMW14433.1 Sec-independent protein translocase subunit TatB [Pseudoalteromonas sp. MT33b]QPL42807.1 Sec-independent protein translocase subunit TatB [Pseudoa|tara:strand:- start:8964 stop:9293 length:330 start_codon:yes stop_codon:yes gene_type:complete